MPWHGLRVLVDYSYSVWLVVNCPAILPGLKGPGNIVCVDKTPKNKPFSMAHLCNSISGMFKF